MHSAAFLFLLSTILKVVTVVVSENSALVQYLKKLSPKRLMKMQPSRAYLLGPLVACDTVPL
jgi:hypothetical protein